MKFEEIDLKSLIIILFIGGLVTFLLWFNIKETNKPNHFMKYGMGSEELFKSELSDLIVQANFQYHEQHLLLSDSSEFYFTIEKILGDPNFIGNIDKVATTNDSIYKIKNSRKLIFVRDKRVVEVYFYH